MGEQGDNLKAEYQERGYVVRPRLLPEGHVAALRERMQAIADSHAAALEAGRGGGASGFGPEDIELEPPRTDGRPRAARKINRCAERDPLFLAHATDPRILDVVEALIGPDIKLYASQCFMKPPGGAEKPYHQDSAYFAIEPMDLVTCWTALDDVTLDNGCLWVLPGSHLAGLVEHIPWWIGGREDKQVAPERLDLAREAPITMPAGSCSFHHSLLLHRSGPNHSDRPRRGLAVHYMSARCRWAVEPTRPRSDFPLLRGREYPGCV